MNKRTFSLIVLINIAIILAGGSIVYYDLWMRPYTPIKVEWYPLGYRPTYRIWDNQVNDYIVIRGSWTLDFLQLSIIIMVLLDLGLTAQTWIERKH